jgi:hypothetical protein
MTHTRENEMPMQYWAVWYPKAAATGLLVARARTACTETVLLHAAPEVITVEVANTEGNRLALGKDLPRTQDSPICRLDIHGARVAREDVWPDRSLVGTTVLLPGGEAGVLKSWWNSEDRMEWRWEVEFYNSIR